MKKTDQMSLDIEVARMKNALDGADPFGPVGFNGEFSDLFPHGGLVLAGTGHRPDALGGYGEPARLRLVAFARHELQKYSTLGHVVSGMALGWDQALAEAALSIGLPVLAAVPCDGQDSTWPADARKRYHALLEHENATMHVVCPGPYAAWKMQVRNEWMVDRCAYLMALYNGDPQGGTANCVNYARKKVEAKRGPCPRIRNVWSDWEEWCRRG
jgi:uncharacterized phage-like protein YoqJ